MKKLRLFGTSGIRGKAKTEITPELAMKLGLTFATFIGNEGTIIVGRDVRLTAEKLSNSIISGLVLGGVNVEDCGIAPTPAILWTLKEKKLDGAVVVTGSHTPKEFIGFLFFTKDTSEFSDSESHQFEKKFFSNVRSVPSHRFGKSSLIDVSGIYRDNLIRYIKYKENDFCDCNIVLDPGNGSAANYFSDIFKTLSIKNITINGKPDGSFPNRDPYPRPEILGSLSKKVVQKRADFGSACDGDGDIG